MTEPRFAYTTYIRTTPEQLWEALTSSAFTRRYWSGTALESDWKVGSPIRFVDPEGTVVDSGTVLEADPPRRLSYLFQVEWVPALKAQGPSRVTFDIEALGPDVKLSLVHDRFPAGSTLVEAYSGGWPQVLACLKSLLETGETLALSDAAKATQMRRQKAAELTGAGSGGA